MVCLISLAKSQGSQDSDKAPPEVCGRSLQYNIVLVDKCKRATREQGLALPAHCLNHNVLHDQHAEISLPMTQISFGKSTDVLLVTMDTASTAATCGTRTPGGSADI